jgi:predicted pyridoxine 5'-phosphate oxidase superfamily flavin-nucleotide-binding protein
MGSAYHAGELEVQERAGVRLMAGKIAGSIHHSLPPVASAFLEQRRFVVVATEGEDGRPWASMLTGQPGFARVLDPRTVRIEAVPVPGDPLEGNLDVSRFIGLIAPDLAARRRLRINGRLERAGDGALLLHADQVYSNCPKYIQRRDGDEGTVERMPVLVRRAGSLTAEQRDWIRRADTFFIATLSPEVGADASHRGGMPGFVTVAGDRLVWPDYTGNSMFNTLGNIAAHPWAGLLFPDFESGAVLQLTGRATIDWDQTRAAAVSGAERLVRFEAEQAVEIAGVLPLGLRLLEYSPFNPAVGAVSRNRDRDRIPCQSIRPE